MSPRRMKHVDIEFWSESFWLWSLESSIKKLKDDSIFMSKRSKVASCHKECNKRAESAGTCRLPIGPTNFDRKFRSMYRFRSNRPEEPIGQPTFQTSVPGDAKIFSERCSWQYLTLRVFHTFYKIHKTWILILKKGIYVLTTIQLQPLKITNWNRLSVPAICWVSVSLCT